MTASETQLLDLSKALTNLVAATAPGMVSIRSAVSRSSGFVWRPGLIVTADDALPEEGDLTVVTAGSDVVPARIAGRDPTTDVALLRVEGRDLRPIELSEATPAVGSLALAIGAEDGAPTAALGVVSLASGPWRSLRGGDIDARIELDLGLRRSGEGGLVVDAGGQAVGMAVFGPRRRVLVIPSATINRAAAELESRGSIARGYLGLGLQTVAVDGSDRSGVIVISVDPKGPAAETGVRQGDILLAWNGEPIRDVHVLLRSLGPASVGQSVRLELSRGGETREVSLVIAEKPGAAADSKTRPATSSRKAAPES